ncbi:MAG: hydroxyneurosporene methyltransferase [Actinomycetota bacterium]|nr:hydroxyneurosporene methyltransferase [Actinomycetota bacterium]
MSEPEADLEALADLCTPWCVRVVATLRIADHIAAGTTDIGGLATAAGVDREALHDVLGHLVGKGVFEEPRPGRFSLNRAAAALLDPATRIGLDLDGIGGRLAYAWGTIPSYVRTGAPAYANLFELPFWEDLDAHPDLAASFDELIGPGGHGAPDAEFDLSDGWERVRTVVDVGGGTGAMLAAILRARPEVRGVLVDLPRTVARSAASFERAGVTDRVTTVGQSFFDPLPPAGDVYLLRGVVNDWPDAEAEVILRRCAEAAAPAGRVVVLKGVTPEEGRRGLPIETVLVGGRHRTVTAFRDLAGRAGLEVVGVGRQASGAVVVECRPA